MNKKVLRDDSMIHCNDWLFTNCQMWWKEIGALFKRVILYYFLWYKFTSENTICIHSH